MSLDELKNTELDFPFIYKKFLQEEIQPFRINLQNYRFFIPINYR